MRSDDSCAFSFARVRPERGFEEQEPPVNLAAAGDARCIVSGSATLPLDSACGHVGRERERDSACTFCVEIQCVQMLVGYWVVSDMR